MKAHLEKEYSITLNMTEVELHDLLLELHELQNGEDRESIKELLVNIQQAINNNKEMVML